VLEHGVSGAVVSAFGIGIPMSSNNAGEKTVSDVQSTTTEERGHEPTVEVAQRRIENLTGSDSTREFYFDSLSSSIVSRSPNLLLQTDRNEDSPLRCFRSFATPPPFPKLPLYSSTSLTKLLSTIGSSCLVRHS
jgi:hypothetical protein